MNTGEAKAIARQWVAEEGEKLPGFRGAMFGGSTNWKTDDTPYAPPSDIDLMIWVDGDTRTLERIYREGVILERSIAPFSRLQRTSAEILSDFRIACHFSVPSIIADPTGYLTYLHQAVAPEYAQRKWVRARCERARTRLYEVIDGWLANHLSSDAVWDQVFDLYYAILVLSEIFALADLRNPTVRKCLVLSQEILQQQGRLDLQEAMLTILGCQQMSRVQVEAHFQVYVQAFDYASARLRTPFFFSADVSANARPISVGGVREIIDHGLPREAMYWMYSIYSVAQKVIQIDGSEVEKSAQLQQYKQQLAELGLHGKVEIAARAERVKALVPEVMQVAEQIMARNPSIRA